MFYSGSESVLEALLVFWRYLCENERILINKLPIFPAKEFLFLHFKSSTSSDMFIFKNIYFFVLIILCSLAEHFSRKSFIYKKIRSKNISLTFSFEYTIKYTAKKRPIFILESILYYMVLLLKIAVAKVTFVTWNTYIYISVYRLLSQKCCQYRLILLGVPVSFFFFFDSL